MSRIVRFYVSYNIKITIKLHFWRKKSEHFVIMYANLLDISLHNATQLYKPLVVCQFKYMALYNFQT